MAPRGAGGKSLTGASGLLCSLWLKRKVEGSGSLGRGSIPVSRDVGLPYEGVGGPDHYPASRGESTFPSWSRCCSSVRSSW